MGERSYAPAFPLPELLERGRANTITCAVYRDTGLVAPTSGTVTLYDAGENALVSAAAITITDNVATYSVSAGTIAASDFGDGWRVEWALVMPDRTEPYTFRNDASLVKSRLYPVISQLDLTRRYSDLARNKPPNKASYQDYVDEAFVDIQARLIAAGRRPWLIMSPSALRSLHMNRTMELIANDFATAAGPDSKWPGIARTHGQAYERDWNGLSFKYDEVGDGTGGKSGRMAGQGPAWFSTHGVPYGGNPWAR